MCCEPLGSDLPAVSKCVDCDGAVDIDGDSLDICGYSPIDCDTCGASPCNDYC